MFKRIAALALIAAAAQAHALTIDFEGLADGQAPGEAYAAQGVHFTGGTVRYNQFGAYLSGPSTMTFDAATAGAGISLLARGFSDDSMSKLLIDGAFYEPVMIPDYDEPTSRPNKVTFPAGTLWPSIVHTGFTVNGIQFNVRELDSLIFNDTALQAKREPGAQLAGVSADVPAPAPIFLIAGGLFLLSLRRLRQLPAADPAKWGESGSVF